MPGQSFGTGIYLQSALFQNHPATKITSQRAQTTATITIQTEDFMTV